MSQQTTVEKSEAPAGTAQSVQLKRQITVKSLVNDNFRAKASKELTDELALIDSQMAQLEAQYNQSIQQLERMAQQGQNVGKQLDNLNREAQERRNQLAALKIEVSTQLANLDKIANGAYIVTGMLENFVEVKIGDNIYEKIRNAEILVEDGIVKAING
jgi:esterase/lipase